RSLGYGTPSFVGSHQARRGRSDQPLRREATLPCQHPAQVEAPLPIGCAGAGVADGDHFWLIAMMGAPSELTVSSFSIREPSTCHCRPSVSWSTSKSRPVPPAGRRYLSA